MRKNILLLLVPIIFLSACHTRPTDVVVTNSEAFFGNHTEVIDFAMKATHDHVVREATLAAVGDVMVHRTQLLRAYDDMGFDFSSSFEYISPYIEEADYAVANLETTLAGSNGQRRIRTEDFVHGYSGYPVFNTPDVMADNLKDAGFDLLLLANNHTLDSKVSGLDRTIDVLDDKGIEHIGAYKTQEDSLEDHIAEINGITFGMLNYTYAMNGFWLSEEEDYKIHHLNNYDQTYINGMYDRVADLAAEEPDFVVVALHYGIEYQDYPDRYYQEPLIDGLFRAGADIILGGHPHVLQPFEVREVVREDGRIEQGVVIYSLGNFISSQKHTYTDYDTDYGMVFQLGLSKVDDQKATIDEIRYLPTYVQWQSRDLVILPIFELPEEVSLSSYDRQRIEHGIGVVVPRINSFHQKEHVLDGPWLVYDLGTK